MKSTKYTGGYAHNVRVRAREETKCKCIYQTLKMERIALDKGHIYTTLFGIVYGPRGDSCYWNGDNECEWFFLLQSSVSLPEQQRMGKQKHNNQ